MYHLITQLFCVGATMWNFSIFCISMVLSGFCCPNSLPLWIHMMKHQHCTAHFTFSCMNKPFLAVFRSLSQYTCFVIFCSSILLPWYCLFWRDHFDSVLRLKHRRLPSILLDSPDLRGKVYTTIFAYAKISQYQYLQRRGRCTGARSPGTKHLSTSVNIAAIKGYEGKIPRRERESTSMSTVCLFDFRDPAILKRESIMATAAQKISNILQHVSLGSDHYALFLGQIQHTSTLIYVRTICRAHPGFYHI